MIREVRVSLMVLRVGGVRSAMHDDDERVVFEAAEGEEVIL